MAGRLGGQCLPEGLGRRDPCKIAAASSPRRIGPHALDQIEANSACSSLVSDNEKPPVEPLVIRKISEGLRGSGKTNADFVIAALREYPGMRPTEVWKFLDDAGFQPNRESVLTCMKRLRHEGRIVKRGTGLYLAST